MENTLEKEFNQTIAAVTKEVTEDVVRHSALASVNELNRTLQTLKNESGQLVSDIHQARDMYQKVAGQSQQSLQQFNQHIDTWQSRQNQLLQAIDKRNEALRNQINQIENNQKQHQTRLEKELDEIRKKQSNQIYQEEQGTRATTTQLNDFKSQLQRAQQVLQSDQVGQTIFLQKKIAHLFYVLVANVILLLCMMLYTFQDSILSLIGG